MNTMEVFYIVFVGLSGLAMGSLAVLMIGYLMSEHWLAPVRGEVEAAALTLPLLLLLGIPPAFGLEQLFPWATWRGDLPLLRAAFLSPGFYLMRSAVYLAVCVGLAFWLIRTRNERRTSAIGLALLTPVMSFAAYDWVLSREPHWWSSLFGFAFGLSQVLAALAMAILLTLLKPEPASPTRMKSLERALLTLALLTIWTWFAQFLIVWLVNLPQGAEWYMRRSDPSDLVLLAVSYGLMLMAVVVLVPSGDRGKRARTSASWNPCHLDPSAPGRSVLVRFGPAGRPCGPLVRCAHNRDAASSHLCGGSRRRALTRHIGAAWFGTLRRVRGCVSDGTNAGSGRSTVVSPSLRSGSGGSGG
jgi:hypothetical protein